MTALLIDDEVQLLDTIRSAADDDDLTVHTAQTWDEGIALFHVLSPNLVIADYNLPGSQNGLKLLREVRSLRPSVRIILISGVVNPDDLDAAEVGKFVDRVLSKGEGIGTTRAIIEEVAAAALSDDEPTDWRTFARGLLDHAATDAGAVDHLDDRMRSQAEGL